MKRIFSILFALALVLGFSLVATTPVAAAVIPVFPGVGTIAAAVAASNPLGGDVIQLMAPGLYWEGHITIPWNLTIMGIPGAIIHPAGPLQADGWASSWFLVSPGVTFVLQDVLMDGTPAFVHQAIRNHGMTTIQNVGFLNIQGAPGSYRGVGIQSYGGTVSGGAGSDSHGGGGASATLQVIGCTFSGIGRIGVLVKGTASTASVSGCTYAGKGAAINCLDYGVEAGAGGTVTVTGNTITTCTGLASDGSTSAGILVTTYYGAGTTATITSNTLTGNTEGIAVGYDASDTSTVVAHLNDLSTNTANGIGSTAPTVDGTCNYWGANNGPGSVGSGSGVGVTTNVNYTPWLTEAYAPTKNVTPTTGGTASFTPAQGSIEDLAAMGPPTPPPAGVTLPYGMFNFTICCFTGSTVTLTITLPGTVPVGTKWYKYNGGAWDALPIGGGGTNVITVTLTDNNLVHDEDPTVGRIVDQGGPGSGGAVGWETYPISKVRVFLPWLALLAAIAAGVSLLVVRRRRVRS